MRKSLACASLLIALSVSLCSASAAESLPDEQTLDSLELRAEQAPPRDQCYLYAELVRETVEYSARQYASGDVEKATSNLKRTQKFVGRFQAMLTGNVKRLKRAQSLLRRAAFRLTDLLHASRYEDRPLIRETLVQVDRAEQDALAHIFSD